MKFTTKQPHNCGVSFRAEPSTLALLEEEAQSSKKSLSRVINNKVRNSFNVLFSEIEKEKKN